eukprot:227616_1
MAFVYIVSLASLTFASRKLVFKNYCEKTIWVGLSANWNKYGNANETYPTWWNEDGSIEANKTQTLIFPTDKVDSVSFWGRTQCNFDVDVPHGANLSDFVCCALGDCECRKICQDKEHPTGGTIRYAGTAGEINFNDIDNYDVANIEGFHIPMTMKPLSPYLNPSSKATNTSCKVAGEVYESIKDWETQILGACAHYSTGQNLVYSVANFTQKILGNYVCDDLEGAEPVVGLRVCVKNTSNPLANTLNYSKFKSYCVSDKNLAGQYIAISSYSIRPDSWPEYYSCGDGPYGCAACSTCPGLPSGATTCIDGCACNACGCKANYHCPKNGDGEVDALCSTTFGCAVNEHTGEKPYINWAKMMWDAGVNHSTYLFVYDDPMAGYACDTLSDNGSTGYEVIFCPANEEKSDIFSEEPATGSPTTSPTTDSRAQMSSNFMTLVLMSLQSIFLCNLV